MVAEFVVRDVLGAQEVLYHDLVDLFFRLWCEFILAHIEMDDLAVALETDLECRRVALLDAVAGDVDLLDHLVVRDVFRETLAEHVAKEVGGEVQLSEAGVLHSEVDAHLGTGFVVEPVELKVQDFQRRVNFERLAKVAGALVVNLVVSEVEMGQDLGLKEVLGDLTGSRVTNLVVGEIDLGDGLVQHQAFN